jgi:hypothetical protein
MSDDAWASPDLRLANTAVLEFGQLVEAWGEHGWRRLTVPELAEISSLSRGKLRGLLHGGWALGWLRPVRAQHSSRIDAWEVDPRFARHAEGYRRHLALRLDELRADFRDFDLGLLDEPFKRR